MGIADTRRRKLVEHVAPQLEDGEQVAATLPYGQTGPTPWLSLLTYLFMFFIKFYGVVATDRRVLLVRRTLLLNRIKGVESVHAPSQVRVVGWKPGAIWGVLKLDVAGAPLRLNVPRMHRTDADGLAVALGYTPEVATA